MSVCPPLDWEIDFGFGSIVRAGEAKLCERVSEKAPSAPRENPLENSSGCSLSLSSSSSAYGLLFFTWVSRILSHFCCYVHGFARTC